MIINVVLVYTKVLSIFREFNIRKYWVYNTHRIIIVTYHFILLGINEIYCYSVILHSFDYFLSSFEVNRKYKSEHILNMHDSCLDNSF